MTTETNYKTIIIVGIIILVLFFGINLVFNNTNNITAQNPELFQTISFGTPVKSIGAQGTEGQPCTNHFECDGYEAQKIGSLACCQGTCTKQIEDWIGVGYCPHECRGSAFSGAGTCRT